MSEAVDILSTIRGVGGDPADLPFWEGTAEGRFLLHRCGVCARHYWPASQCVDHGSADMAWVESSGRGALETYTVLHHAYTPAMRDKVPYVVGVIRLDEGPYYHSNVVGCDRDAVSVGMRLSARMETHESGLTLPVFHPDP